ncbi:MAG: hypothetical protein NVS9B3_09040 [Gemmatimonadaceae bacterium]
MPIALTAQDACTRSPVTAATVGRYSGRPLRAMRLDVGPLAPLPGPLAAATRLHVTTRQAVVRRYVLFAGASTIDTTAVLETLRDLRAVRLFDDVGIVAEQCTADSAVTLVVTTHDTWSTRGTVRASSTGRTLLQLEERNFLGSGRAVGGFAEVGPQQAIGMTFRDPAFLGTSLRAAAAFGSYADGRIWRGSVRTADLSVFDDWRLVASTAQYHRASPSAADSLPYSLGRRGTSLLVARSVLRSATAVIALLAGVEHEQTALDITPVGQVIGPVSVRRTFIAADLGVARRTADYAAVDWVVSRHRPVDVPLGLEWELLVGAGRDSATRGLILHPDVWTGKIWAPGNHALVGVDVWASAYRVRDSISAGSVRAAMSLFSLAPHGLWILRGAAERLVNPDPDIYALATIDPLLRSAAPRLALASEAFVGSAERTVHLWNPDTHRFALDAAVFVSYSARQGGIDPETDGLANVYAGVAGIGLRTAGSTANPSPWRLDIGFPVVRSATLNPRVLVAVSVSPWITDGRGREGQRLR